MEQVETFKELNNSKHREIEKLNIRLRELEHELNIKRDLEKAYLSDIEIRKHSYQNLLLEFS